VINLKYSSEEKERRRKEKMTIDKFKIKKNQDYMKIRIKERRMIKTNK
jgi:hypothetical protein